MMERKRSCLNCGYSKHCSGRYAGQDCPDWKPDAQFEKKTPVAGCEYCRPKASQYQTSSHTELYLDTLGSHRILQTRCQPCPPHSRCSSNGRSFRASFVINFCPNCGRDLRGES